MNSCKHHKAEVEEEEEEEEALVNLRIFPFT
jgi:hypothetical protein